MGGHADTQNGRSRTLPATSPLPAAPQAIPAKAGNGSSLRKKAKPKADEVSGSSQK